MIELRESLQQWLWLYHKDILPLLLLGHTELMDDEMWDEYMEWWKEKHEV